MFIKERLSQHRNDFTATLKCEHCGAERYLTSGYDDAYYHQKVVPSLECNQCGKDRAGNSKPVQPVGGCVVSSRDFYQHGTNINSGCGQDDCIECEHLEKQLATLTAERDRAKWVCAELLNEIRAYQGEGEFEEGSPTKYHCDLLKAVIDNNAAAIDSARQAEKGD